MISIEDILHPVSDKECCGGDLFETGELYELESLATPRHATNAEGRRLAKDEALREPEWAKLAARCEELLSKSRDLRVAAFYAASSLRSEGIPGFARAVELMWRLLEKWGAAAHPAVDLQQSDSVRERLMAMVGIAAPYKSDGDLLRVIEGLRKTPLAPADGGHYDYAKVIAARHPDGGDDDAIIRAIRSHWLKAGTGKKQEMLAALRLSIESLLAIEAWIGSQLPPEYVPSDPAMSSVLPLVGELKSIAKILDDDAPPAMPAKTTTLQTMNEQNTGAMPANPGAPGEIQSREDAIRLLRQVRDYFQRSEPTCPANFFIERAIKLVGKNFLEALADLLPESTAKFEELTGLTQTDEKKDGN